MTIHRVFTNTKFARFYEFLHFYVLLDKLKVMYYFQIFDTMVCFNQMFG